MTNNPQMTKWPDEALSDKDRKHLADQPRKHRFIFEQHPTHPTELVACLEAEIKMLREENARLGRQLFDARYRDWL